MVLECEKGLYPSLASFSAHRFGPATDVSCGHVWITPKLFSLLIHHSHTLAVFRWRGLQLLVSPHSIGDIPKVLPHSLVCLCCGVRCAPDHYSAARLWASQGSQRCCCHWWASPPNPHSLALLQSERGHFLRLPTNSPKSYRNRPGLVWSALPKFTRIFPCFTTTGPFSEQCLRICHHHL